MEGTGSPADRMALGSDENMQAAGNELAGGFTEGVDAAFHDDRLWIGPQGAIKMVNDSWDPYDRN